MFYEALQYSSKDSLWDYIKFIIQNFSNDQKVLPIYTSTNNVRCLDFDMDNVVFEHVKKNPVNFPDIKCIAANTSRRESEMV
jgi:hypothetical protein